MTGRITVAGLGPAGPELVTAATSQAIADHPHRRLRTARHPAAVVADPAETFDHVYESAGRLDDVYPTIVEHLLAEVADLGDVLYLVPGSPTVAERTVELLLEQHEADITVLPALSFIDLAWVRLRVDPVARGVRIVDGHRFATEAAGVAGPMLVAQCDSVEVLSEIKLAVEGANPPEVTALQALGTPDEVIATVPWDELDRIVEPDHLTSLWIPPLRPPVAAELQRFADLVVTLRRECPWDREQTHQSLTRHLVEESYEVLDAIDGLDEDPEAGYVHLEEELGDLLFQVVFHATLATEAGEFTLADVARGIHDKLVLRHPHVFDQVAVDGSADVVANWEAIKQQEKGRDSVFDGTPRGLPALLRALKLLRKADAAGLGGAPDAGATAEQLLRALDRPDPEVTGAVLLTLVERVGGAGVDPEAALRQATDALEQELRGREADRRR